MIGILVLFYLMVMPSEVRMAEVAPDAVPKQQKAPEERKQIEQEIPRDLERAEIKNLPLVLIEIDAKGRVNAKSGDKKLAAFDGNAKEKMKPLDLWLGKIVVKGKVRVQVKVDGDVIQQHVTNILKVMAKHEITEITFTDLGGQE